MFDGNSLSKWFGVIGCLGEALLAFILNLSWMVDILAMMAGDLSKVDMQMVNITLDGLFGLSVISFQFGTYFGISLSSIFPMITMMRDVFSIQVLMMSCHTWTSQPMPSSTFFMSSP